LYFGLEPPAEPPGFDPPVEPVGFEPPVEYVFRLTLEFGLEPPVGPVVLDPPPPPEFLTLAGLSAAGFGGAEPLFLSFLLSSARRMVDSDSINAIRDTPTRTRKRAFELLEMFIRKLLGVAILFSRAD
jgi:hypothetical protein